MGLMVVFLDEQVPDRSCLAELEELGESGPSRASDLALIELDLGELLAAGLPGWVGGGDGGGRSGKGRARARDVGDRGGGKGGEEMRGRRLSSLGNDVGRYNRHWEEKERKNRRFST
jgi:hypothetical protein